MDDNKWVIDGGDPKEEGEYYVRYRKTKLVDIGWESIDVSEYTTYKNGMWGFSVEPETTSVKILAWQKCNPKSIDKENMVDNSKIEERRVIQITSCVYSTSALGSNHIYIHALCNDGTIWRLTDGSIHSWIKEPAIPQDNQKERAL